MILLTCSAGLVPSWSPDGSEDPTQQQTGASHRRVAPRAAGTTNSPLLHLRLRPPPPSASSLSFRACSPNICRLPTPPAAIIFIALYTIAVGTGGIKPNVSAFGADQFDPRQPAQKVEKNSFFNWCGPPPGPGRPASLLSIFWSVKCCEDPKEALSDPSKRHNALWAQVLLHGECGVSHRLDRHRLYPGEGVMEGARAPRRLFFLFWRERPIRVESWGSINASVFGAPLPFSTRPLHQYQCVVAAALFASSLRCGRAAPPNLACRRSASGSPRWRWRCPSSASRRARTATSTQPPAGSPRSPAASSW